MRPELIECTIEATKEVFGSQGWNKNKERNILNRAKQLYILRLLNPEIEPFVFGNLPTNPDSKDPLLGPEAIQDHIGILNV